VLGVVPDHAAGNLHEGNDEIGSSCETHEVSQEEARAEEATAEEEEREPKPPHCDCPPTRETTQKNLESGGTAEHIGQRIALHMQRDQQAPDRAQTTKVLHQARFATEKLQQ